MVSLGFQPEVHSAHHHGSRGATALVSVGFEPNDPITASVLTRGAFCLRGAVSQPRPRPVAGSIQLSMKLLVVEQLVVTGSSKQFVQPRAAKQDVVARVAQEFIVVLAAE